MGVLERKGREKIEMRDAILVAATEMFLKEGFEKTSIRAIAERIEYSVGTIYIYFRDKTELLNALMEQGFQKLGKTMRKVKFGENPIENLKTLGYNYIKFAIENKEYYDLMFIMKKPMELVDREWVSGTNALNLLRSTIFACIQEKKLTISDEESATLVLWGVVHGLSSLYSRKRLIMFDQDKIENDIYKAVNIFIDGITK